MFYFLKCGEFEQNQDKYKSLEKSLKMLPLNLPALSTLLRGWGHQQYAFGVKTHLHYVIKSVFNAEHYTTKHSTAAQTASTNLSDSQLVL